MGRSRLVAPDMLGSSGSVHQPGNDQDDRRCQDSHVGIYAHSDLRPAAEERLEIERAKTAEVKRSQLQLKRIFEQLGRKRPRAR